MRLLRTALLGLVLLLLLAVAAAWVLPGMLDWNGDRMLIAAYAGSAIGRPIRIDGPITLHLFPEPELTAARISVAGSDAGLGLTARELRLRVGLGALLQGRIDARALVLQSPELRLPWPLDFRPSLARPPGWLAGLHARIEDGRLAIGRVVLTNVAGVLSRNADTGTLAARGVAEAAGRPWRFSVRLSEPGGDGTAALDLGVDGDGPVAGTRVTFSGQVARDGALQGQVTGGGADLAALLPGPAVAWRGEGRLTASGGLVAADELALRIGASPATGAVALRLSPAVRLDVALAASRLDLNAWLPALLGQSAPALPTGIDLSAEAADLHGALLGRLRAAFDLHRDSVTLREASATLPGDAALRLTGRIARGRGPPRFTGTASLAAPDLHTTLHWLAGFGLRGIDAAPATALRSADLTATVTAAGGRVSLTELRGTLDAAQLSGELAWQSGARPLVKAELSLDRLPLDPWLPASPPALAALAAAPRGFDLDLDLAARHASWQGEAIDGLHLVATATASGGLHLQRGAATLRGWTITGAGTIASGGVVRGAELTATAPDGQALGALLPEDWRGTPALWRGPVALHATADGPPKALDVDLGLDLGDARLEARPRVDLPAGTWSGPLTLRHPGASRLLRMLGLGQADWIGEGSLALIADVHGDAAGWTADRFDLTAGDLRATGDLAFAAGRRTLSGHVHAERLPLPWPGLRSAAPMRLLDWLGLAQGWQARLQVDAGEVLLGDASVLQQVSAAVTLRDRSLQIHELAARLGGGTLHGDLALDVGAASPQFTASAALSGAVVSGPVLDLPLDLTDGRLDGTLQVHGDGRAPSAILATLDGTVDATAGEGMVSGFDLDRLRRVLSAAKDDALRPTAQVAEAAAALRGGDSGFDTLALHGTIRHGELTLSASHMQGSEGGATLDGSADLIGDALDLRLQLRPAVSGAPAVGLLLAGPAASPRLVPELAGLARWQASAH